jgi:hypothetical protein
MSSPAPMRGLLDQRERRVVNDRDVMLTSDTPSVRHGEL